MEILFHLFSLFVCTCFANPLMRQRRQQETDCQMRFRINQPEWTKPVCNYDGSYRPYQCEAYSQYKCWCVYDNGMMIPDSAQDLNGDPAKQYKKLKCAEKKAKAPPAPKAPPIETPFTSRRLGWHLAYRDAAKQAAMCPSNCPSPCPCTPGQTYYPYSSYNNYDPYTSQMQQYGCPQPCPEPCPCQQPSAPPFYPAPPPQPMPAVSYPSYQPMSPDPAACPVPCPDPCPCQQAGSPFAQTMAQGNSYSDSDVNAYGRDRVTRNEVTRAESGNDDNSDDVDDDDEDDDTDEDDTDREEAPEN